MSKEFVPDDKGELYTARELVDFGNYLLSEKRKIEVQPENQNEVHNEDFDRWLNSSH